MAQREYEFRGMTLGGEWVYGNLSVSQGYKAQPPKGFYISNRCGMPWAYAVRPETVGQWIGLSDTKLQKIFEQDIAKNSANQIGEIKWLQEHCAYVVRVKEPHQYCFLDSDGILNDVEIVGNIHQNPELLEGSGEG